MRPPPSSISVVAPAHDERDSLPLLVDRLAPVLARHAERYELIIVDDASDDDTFEVLRGLAAERPWVRGLRLSRQAGHQAALTCGLQAARGEVVIMMDADLQHPPEIIDDMVAAWRAGADIVNTRGVSTLGRSRIETWLASLFYALFNWLSVTRIVPAGADFRLLDRRCVDVLVELPETGRFYRGLVSHIGFVQETLEVAYPARLRGRRSFSFGASTRLALRAIVAFSSRALRWPLYLGLVGLPIALIALVVKLSEPGAADRVCGAAELCAGDLVILCVVAVQLIFAGVLGVYLADVQTQVRRRPRFFVREALGAPPAWTAERTAGPTEAE